ncbi:hypothetical protein [Actinokineospora iranica]|uniref:Uncharacterized protein n=1 Tax=Actinokineospora iranica TaxID=1271860 RepID=A0A1G6VWS9_9PSEU|nr:hypothetical protein [Actinokineospora iranica]SDD58031.1 hypothetical protein SAMN05216174_113140 [Actinokineospora iranica]
MTTPLPRPDHMVVKLRADWDAGPLWVSTGDDVPEPFTAEDITEIAPLSHDLQTAITAWDTRFQGTYDEDTPQNSGFQNDAERTAFIQDGRALARRLAAELPTGTKVGYVPLDTGTWEPVED